MLNEGGYTGTGDDPVGVVHVSEYWVACRCGAIAYFHDDKHVTGDSHTTPECVATVRRDTDA